MAGNVDSESLKGLVVPFPYSHISSSRSIAVVDVCQFGLLGLGSLLTLPAHSQGTISVSVHERIEEALNVAHNGPVRIRGCRVERCLVLRLSIRPAQALQQLLCLENELMTWAGFRRLIILSPFEVNNVIRQVLVCGGVRVPVCIESARSPVMWLRRLVLSQGSLLQAENDELLPLMPALVLTTPERRVLSATLQEIPIYLQARRQHCNNKTLYAQRHNALRKLGSSGVADLLRRFVSM